MNLSDIFRAWGVILQGRQPVLSIEITKDCPLSCPGCYAYQSEHVSGMPLESMADLKGDRLVGELLELVERRKPVGVFIVGGEPLVRFRELNTLLPELSKRDIRVEVVTSAVRPIPAEWKHIPKLEISVSVDGLQPEHDERRKPATYERILKHIEGHPVTIHCTVTGQMVRRDGYLERFLEFWNERSSVRDIRMSLYTPQIGEQSEEILTFQERRRAVETLSALAPRFSKLRSNSAILEAYLSPPLNPDECTFARLTACLSADLKSPVTPCQLGGNPSCAECGCMAAVGLNALGRHRLTPGIRIGSILKMSEKIGAVCRRITRGGPDSFRKAPSEKSVGSGPAEQPPGRVSTLEEG